MGNQISNEFLSAPFTVVENLGSGLLGPLAGIDLATDIRITYTVDGVPDILDATVTVVPEPSSFALAVFGQAGLLALAGQILDRVHAHRKREIS